MRKWTILAVSVALATLLGLVAVVAAADTLPKRGTIKPLLLAGAGSQTSPGSEGCQFDPGYCDVEFQGTAQFGPLAGLPAGPWNWTSNLRIYWNEAKPNGQGGYCARAIGQFTVQHSHHGSFVAHQTGTVCEVGPTGSPIPHIFEGNFTIVSGSGPKLANVGGSGTVSAYKASDGSTSVSLSGVQFKNP
jgi:hypothetical protein